MKINDDTFAWVLHGVHAFSADAWIFARYLLFPAFALALLAANANAASTPQIISQLVSIRFLLSQLGPALSAIHTGVYSNYLAWVVAGFVLVSALVLLR